MNISAAVLVFMAASMATCRADPFSWIFGTNRWNTVGRLDQDDMKEYGNAWRNADMLRDNKKRIEEMIESSSQLENLVQTYHKWVGRRRSNERAVHKLIQRLGHGDSNDYTKLDRYNKYKINPQKFDQARNRFLVPPCRELIDQIGKLGLSLSFTTEIDGDGYETVNNVVSLEKVCRKALEWTSTDTFNLQEEF